MVGNTTTEVKSTGLGVAGAGDEAREDEEDATRSGISEVMRGDLRLARTCIRCLCRRASPIFSKANVAGGHERNCSHSTLKFTLTS